MRLKRLLQQSLYVLLSIWIIWFFINFFLNSDRIYTTIIYTVARILSVSNTDLNIDSETVSTTFLKKNNSEIPLRLRIPTIEVDTRIRWLWLTPIGTMDTTKGPDDVAWFNLGPLPWKKGSSVIAGHYWERKNGKISVFHDLNKLVKWNKVYVEDNSWRITTFIVRKSKVYASSNNASEVFISHDNKSHLNLITCNGIWDALAKTYQQRLVVFTDKE